MHHPEVYIGTIQPYEGGRPSGIAKRLVDGAVKLTPLGLEGDEQAEKVITAGQTARCVTIPVNITTTGASSFRRRQNSSAHRPLVRISLPWG